MFGKKIKYNDDELGEFTFSYSCWNAQPGTGSHGKIFVGVEGDKTGPDSQSLIQARELFTNITKYIEDAKSFIETKDISEFMEGNGSLVFDGFHSRGEIGLFDLDFGLSSWDDASIEVHFKGNIPYDISLGD